MGFRVLGFKNFRVLGLLSTARRDLEWLSASCPPFWVAELFAWQAEPQR